MYFGLSQVEIRIVSFSNGPGEIKNTGVIFKSKTKASSKVSVVDIFFLPVVLAPTTIRQ